MLRTFVSSIVLLHEDCRTCDWHPHRSRCKHLVFPSFSLWCITFSLPGALVTLPDLWVISPGFVPGAPVNQTSIAGQFPHGRAPIQYRPSGHRVGRLISESALRIWCPPAPLSLGLVRVTYAVVKVRPNLIRLPGCQAIL